MNFETSNSYQDLHSLFGNPAHPLSWDFVMSVPKPARKLSLIPGRDLYVNAWSGELGISSSFGHIVDFKNTQKAFLCPVAKHFAIVPSILTATHACMRMTLV